MITTRKLAVRRWRNLALTALAAVTLLALVRAQHDALIASAFTTGWLLMGAMLVLALYNGRKKIPFLPLLSSATWLQWHIYIGLLTVVLFVAHAFHSPPVGFHLPNGVFEVSLALLYIVVAGSGLVGLALSRTIPRLLAQRGEEVIFERIPLYRRQIAERARDLCVASVAESDATTIADYYTQRLARFFDRPRHLLLHLVQSQRPRNTLLAELNDLEAYLSSDERTYADELRDLVRRKDDLDYHHALQLTLKGWLFVHIGLTFGLLLAAALHGAMAHMFSGGV
ncbi:MAG: hypothetical protein ACODAQ_03895 [Phycisphaeraceae bacterium]